MKIFTFSFLKTEKRVIIGDGSKLYLMMMKWNLRKISHVFIIILNIFFDRWVGSVGDQGFKIWN